MKSILNKLNKIEIHSIKAGNLNFNASSINDFFQSISDSFENKSILVVNTKSGFFTIASSIKNPNFIVTSIISDFDSILKKNLNISETSIPNCIVNNIDFFKNKIFDIAIVEPFCDKNKFSDLSAIISASKSAKVVYGLFKKENRNILLQKIPEVKIINEISLKLQESSKHQKSGNSNIIFDVIQINS